MHEFMHVRNYSERTQKTYLGAVAKFAAFFHTPPDKLGPPEILTYQLHLRDERHVSFSFFNQVMSALRLFYGEVLEREEMIERIPFMHRDADDSGGDGTRASAHHPDLHTRHPRQDRESARSHHACQQALGRWTTRRPSA